MTRHFSFENMNIISVQKFERSGVQPSEKLLSFGIMRGRVKFLLKPLEHNSTIIQRGLKGPSSLPPLCRREILVRQTADVIFPVWEWGFFSLEPISFVPYKKNQVCYARFFFSLTWRDSVSNSCFHWLGVLDLVERIIYIFKEKTCNLLLFLFYDM